MKFLPAKTLAKNVVPMIRYKREDCSILIILNLIIIPFEFNTFLGSVFLLFWNIELGSDSLHISIIYTSEVLQKSL